ncbi:MAG: proprotein convertase P-domain-containing protein, partial [Thermoanaerobaculia bacterium]|nr:proprotein convertase P-domain-containing protein [Thermoanaerobaculia bacterium]
MPVCRLLPIAGLLIFLTGRLSAQSGCSCTNCPQALPDNFEGDFLIQVQNAANPVLGQNGQGVCGVTLHFDHEFIGDLLITLTSPAGQTVTLVGQTGFFGETDGTDWEVTFVPCNTPADPDPGFSPLWDNDQPWGVFGNYTGSYFPNAGCLQDFNTGPVNGQWTLNVLDALPNDAGNFYDYQIIFCDPTGIECYTCEADGGNLLQPDTSFCAGDTTLLLDLPPAYPNLPPPAGNYAYTYIISAGGVILGYDPLPDLRDYPAGMYTVCGLSYLGSDASKIPLPDGVLTVAELTALLNSSSPPFCGNVTTNCVNIDIVPLPDNITDSAVICAPDCYPYFDTSFCNSGVYTVQLFKDNCPYTATLYLTVLQPATKDIYEDICPGACAQTPGFGQYCETGDYTAAFPGSNGCDSLVTLHLTVLNAEASIVPPQALSCSQTEVALSGAGSSVGGPGITYQWTAQSGGSLTGPTQQVDATATAPGTYQLIVCHAGAALICCDTAYAMVVANQNPPLPPPAIIGPDRVCVGQDVDFRAEPAQYASTYNWSVPSGGILISGQGTPAVSVSWLDTIGGNICVTAENACGLSAPLCMPVEVSSAPDAPFIEGPDTLCAGSSGWFTANPASGFSGYLWEVKGGAILGDTDSAAIEVRWNDKDSTGALCIRALNDCGPGEQFCRTITLIVPPEIQAGTDTTVCGTALTLTGSADTAAYWDFVSGPGSVMFSDTTSGGTFADVTLPGVYKFRIVRPQGVCVNADTVQITFSPLPEIGQPAYACDAVGENYAATLSISGGVTPYLVNGSPLNGNLFMSPWLANGVPYTVQVSDSIGCSAFRTDSFACPCVSFAGYMNKQLMQVCEGQTVKAQHLGGQFLDANDTAVFMLHTASGDSIGQIIDQNTNGEFGFQPGMDFGSTYYISYVVGNSDNNGYPGINDPCLSVAAGQPVIFYANPIVNAGADTAICGNSIMLNAVPANGQWTVTPAGPFNAITVADPQHPQTGVFSTQPGKYSLKWSATENGCPGSDEITIQFNEKPDVSDVTITCAPDNENYTVQFQIVGGTPPFTLNGTLLANNYFQSNSIFSGQNYQFSIGDSNGCAAPEISGTHICDCITDAGSMSQDTIIVCGTDTIQVVSEGNYQLDNNDITEYVLHTSSGPNLGQILARNQSGYFTFVPGLQYGETYYVSLVAGNSKNGMPDPGGPCFSVAAGQPVVFIEKPQPHGSPGWTVCGQITQLNVATGSFPGIWSLQSGQGKVDFAAVDAVHTPVAVSESGFYVFRWTEMNGQCMASVDIAVTFFDQPEVQNLKENCNGTNTAFSVSFDLAGGTPPFKIDGLNGILNGPFFLSLPLFNNEQYGFTVTDANGCATPPVSGS